MTEFAAIPTGPSAPWAVMMVTPVGRWPKTARKLSAGIDEVKKHAEYGPDPCLSIVATPKFLGEFGEIAKRAVLGSLGQLWHCPWMRLGELLALDQFHLSMVSAAGGDADPPIAGAHISEMPAPSRFLAPDWLMLTLGIRLRGDASAQRRLVAELHESGISALGFGLGVAFQRAPRALLEEANGRSLPVFAVPYETPFRDIVAYVNRALLSTTVRDLQRAASMQNLLLEALADERPERTIVNQLAGLFEGTVILFDTHGHVEASSGRGDFANVWSSIERDPLAVTTVRLEGRELTTLAVGHQSSPQRWLAVVSTRPTLPRSLIHSVLRSAERLLCTVEIGKRAAAVERRAVRLELLEDALTVPLRVNGPDLEARLRHHGIDFTTSVRAMAIELQDELASSVDRDAMRHAAEEYLQHLAVPFLVAKRPRGVVVLAQADDREFEELASSIEGVHRTAIRAGLGRAVKTGLEIASSLQDAESLLRRESLSSRNGLLRFEDVDLANWLVSTSSSEEVEIKAAAVLGPLLDNEELRATLAAYLSNGLRTAATAAALNIHENTLRYRLGRLEECTGRSLKDIHSLVDFRLALLILGR